MVAPSACARKLLSFFPFLLVLFDLQYEGVVSGINADVDKHLEMGKKLLAAGQLADALSHFHSAIDGDPDNYLAYYRRATAYLAMGKSKAAIPDLSRVIELKPDFTSARLQRGQLLLKQGKLDEAEEDFKKVLKSNPSDQEEKEATLQLAKSDEIQRMRLQGIAAFDKEDYTTAESLLSVVLETCVWDGESRELRAECYINQGEPGKAISDLKAACKLKSDNTAAFYKVSRIYYHLGDHEMSLRYEEAISKYGAVLKTEPNIPSYAALVEERLCHCYSKNQQPTEAIKECTEFLQKDPNNVNALKDRAEAYIQEEMYEEAVRDYETAQQNSDNDKQIREGLEKAQRLLKQSQKKDYYKILGVKRNAKKQEIIKAYRKLAQQWHPDNFQNEEEKKRAEKKFIDIASAKEVLTDPEKRSRFDAGEDPLDPESQQGGGSHFHRGWNQWQGFNPFGSGGPFNFKFNFN
ncbi:hypothetical protein GDO78_000600 [Eleutherodactylus coqui]|uniref:DnaJ homolog subfamily C member 3 n=1 Tax=Eleutherodactylus coqui TaxID=57060 RepID=A0A8J6KGJ3_ELECQ|nr:hypothetical protein GDO78_000600 [Eleutherodactylus coqui]